MRKLGKLLLTTSVIFVVALSAFGCQKTTECDGCGDEKKCSEYEMLDEKVWFCDDCAEAIEEIQDALD